MRCKGTLLFWSKQIISYFCSQIYVKMKKFVKFSGTGLILLGTLLLIISYFTGLANYNVVLFSGLLMIIAGIVLSVILFRKESKY